MTGGGVEADPAAQWTTVAQALAELKAMGDEASDAFKPAFRNLR